MILDVQSNPKVFEDNGLQGGHVFVNEKEVQLVWYIDTDAGIVKSRDVFGDGKVHRASEINEQVGALTDIEITGQVLSKTFQGKLDIIRADGTKFEPAKSQSRSSGTEKLTGAPRG